MLSLNLICLRQMLASSPLTKTSLAVLSTAALTMPRPGAAPSISCKALVVRVSDQSRQLLLYQPDARVETKIVREVPTPLRAATTKYRREPTELNNTLADVKKQFSVSPAALPNYYSSAFQPSHFVFYRALDEHLTKTTNDLNDLVSKVDKMIANQRREFKVLYACLVKSFEQRTEREAALADSSMKTNTSQPSLNKRWPPCC